MSMTPALTPSPVKPSPCHSSTLVAASPSEITASFGDDGETSSQGSGSTATTGCRTQPTAGWRSNSGSSATGR
jgi:hypothetical protein